MIFKFLIQILNRRKDSDPALLKGCKLQDPPSEPRILLTGRHSLSSAKQWKTLLVTVTRTQPGRLGHRDSVEKSGHYGMAGAAGALLGRLVGPRPGSRREPAHGP